MGAKQDSTETCATVNAGGVHRAVTGKWEIAACIFQLEDLGNCVKEHATKGVWMDVPRLREHATAVSLKDMEISVTSHATYSRNANITLLNVRIWNIVYL